MAPFTMRSFLTIMFVLGTMALFLFTKQAEALTAGPCPTITPNAASTFAVDFNPFVSTHPSTAGSTGSWYEIRRSSSVWDSKLKCIQFAFTQTSAANPFTNGVTITGQTSGGEGKMGQMAFHGRPGHGSGEHGGNPGYNSGEQGGSPSTGSGQIVTVSGTITQTSVADANTWSASLTTTGASYSFPANYIIAGTDNNASPTVIVLYSCTLSGAYHQDNFWVIANSMNPSPIAVNTAVNAATAAGVPTTLQKAVPVYC